VVKYVDAAEVHIVAATVLAAATNAVLVAHHLQKLGAHLITAMAHLHVRNLARKKKPGGRKHAEENGRAGGEGAESPSQQVISNLAALQQERVSTPI